MAEILLYGRDGTVRSIVPRLEEPLAGMPVPAQPAFLVGSMGADLRTFVYDHDGNRLAELAADIGYARFVRDGMTIAVSDFDNVQRTSDAQVRVCTLRGAPLEATPADHAPFDHHIHSPEGALVGSMAGPVRTTYHGDDLPEQLALHAAAVALIGEGAVAAPEAVETPSVDAASAAFAREAERRLLTGDRTGAIVAALKGLPETPDNADPERFKAAHLLLYRSAAARVLRLALDPSMIPLVGPTGRVMVVSGERPMLRDARWKATDDW